MKKSIREQAWEKNDEIRSLAKVGDTIMYKSPLCGRVKSSRVTGYEYNFGWSIADNIENVVRLEDLLGVVVEFNKGNWTGELTHLVYHRGTGEFTIGSYGDTVFTLEQAESDSDEERYVVRSSDHSPEDEMCTVGRWAWDDPDEYTAFAMDITREGNTPFLAAARMICMIY